jgi:hypothetical protein
MIFKWVPFHFGYNFEIANVQYPARKLGQPLGGSYEHGLFNNKDGILCYVAVLKLVGWGIFMKTLIKNINKFSFFRWFQLWI